MGGHGPNCPLSGDPRDPDARSVCAWAGIPLPEAEVNQRTQELNALFEGAGSVRPKHWWSRVSRNKAERWIDGLVHEIRSGRTDAPR